MAVSASGTCYFASQKTNIHSHLIIHNAVLKRNEWALRMHAFICTSSLSYSTNSFKMFCSLYCKTIWSHKHISFMPHHCMSDHSRQEQETSGRMSSVCTASPVNARTDCRGNGRRAQTLQGIDSTNRYHATLWRQQTPNLPFFKNYI